MSIGVIGVGRDRLLGVLDSFLERLLVPLVQALEIIYMGLGVDRAGTCKQGVFLRCQLDSDLLANRPCDLALQRQHIAQLPFVALRP